MDGLRGEDCIAEPCRREGLSQGVYYKWSKDFMEAGKRRLAGDTARAATTDEVKDLRRESRDLKEVVADQSPKPNHVWNCIPDEVRSKVVKLALKETELSPRELAVTFTDKIGRAHV